MKNSSMAAPPSDISQSLLARTKEPATELAPAVFVLYLFVIFQVVGNYQSRAFSSPLTASNLLLSSTGDNTELMSVSTFDDDIGFLLCDEVLNVEVSSEIFILGKFVRDISEVLNSHFFRASDKYDVVFLSETDIGKDKVMGETSGLGVVAWRSEEHTSELQSR